MQFLEVPAIIDTAKKNDFLHVFLINGPVALITSKLIIDTYGLDENNVFLSCTRDTDMKIINSQPFIPNDYWYDRYFEKILSIRLKSLRILKEINKKNKNFIFYSSWAELGTEKIIASKFCKGHIYIEEGQGAYLNLKPFRYKPQLIIVNIIQNLYLFIARKRVLYATDRQDLFRDDAQAFIGITSNAFPMAPKEKRYILENYTTLKNHYKPKLLGVKTVGLTCADRRIRPPQWKSMLKALVEKMPEGGVIKLHPSFCADKKKVDIMKSLLRVINAPDIRICDDDIIIEIEMLYEKKELIGPLTSLSIYANAFGSKFEDIKLY